MNTENSQTPRENISTPLNPLTASEKQLLKQSIKESQAIYKTLLPSKQIKCRKSKGSDLFFLLTFHPLLTFGQVNIKGVVSTQDGQPLAYTNLVSISKKTGTTTTNHGTYQLSGLEADDTVKITNISFQPIIISVKELLQTDTIYLKEKMLSLDEVVITNFKAFRDKEKIGNITAKTNYSFSGMPTSQIGMFIENKRKIPGWIKELTFKIKREGSCKNDFRIRFIKFDPVQGKPTTDITYENIIIKGGDVKSTTKIDLSDYKIIMPGSGVVVLFEWLDTDPNCNQESRTRVIGNMNMHKDLMWFNYKDQSFHQIARNYPTGEYTGLNVGLIVEY